MMWLCFVSSFIWVFLGVSCFFSIFFASFVRFIDFLDLKVLESTSVVTSAEYGQDRPPDGFIDCGLEVKKDRGQKAVGPQIAEKKRKKSEKRSSAKKWSNPELRLKSVKRSSGKSGVPQNCVKKA